MNKIHHLHRCLNRFYKASEHIENKTMCKYVISIKDYLEECTTFPMHKKYTPESFKRFESLEEYTKNINDGLKSKVNEMFNDAKENFLMM